MKRNWAKITFLTLALTLAVWGCESPTTPTDTTSRTIVDPPPPPPPPPKTVYQEVTIPAGVVTNLCPQIWNRAADRDFGGNGPEVEITAEMTQWSDTEMRLRIWFRATETTNDWTATSGFWYFTRYTAPSGWVIDEVLSVNYSNFFYVDNDHAYDHLYPADTFVTYAIVRGDTDGNDVGNCTPDDTRLVHLEYREVKIRLRKL